MSVQTQISHKYRPTIVLFLLAITAGGAFVYSQTPPKPAVPVVASSAAIASAPENTNVNVSAVEATLTIALWENKSYLIQTSPGQPPTFNPVTIAYIKLGGGGIIPGPSPDPLPNPDPIPNPTGFKGEIKAAIAKVATNAQPERKTLAGLYTSLAAEAAANPGSWDAALLFNEKKQRIATELSAPMLAAWQPYFKDEAAALVRLKIQANDLKAGIQALTDMAEVLGQ